jgi:hypothetical protein
LNLTFDESTKIITQWAENFSDVAGRSKYDLQELAKTIGPVMAARMGENKAAAAEMSAGLSQLAVDLSTVFGQTELEVLEGLRGAMEGMERSVKKFGISLSEAEISSEALALGLGADTKNLTEAQKATIRYNLILKQTASYQGNAERKSKSLENMVKRLRGMFKDFAINMGMEVTPYLADVLQLFVSVAKVLFRDVLPVFGKLISTAATVAKGIGTLVWGLLKLAWAVNPLVRGAALGILAGMFVKSALGAGLLNKALLLLQKNPLVVLLSLWILIIEDLITWVNGGNSVFGKLFDTLTEVTGLPVSDWIKDIVKWFMRLAVDPVKAIEILNNALSTYIPEIVGYLSDMDPSDVIDKWNAFGRTISAVCGIIANAIYLLGGLVGAEDRLKFFKERSAEQRKLMQELGSARELGSRAAMREWGVPSSMLSPRPTTATASPGRSGPFLANLSNSVNVSVKATPGMDEKRLAREVASQVGDALQRQNRATMRALVPATVR